MSEPRPQQEIQPIFQQKVYDYGWMVYRIRNSTIQAQGGQLGGMELEIQAILAEAEARAKLDADKPKEEQPKVETKEVENGKDNNSPQISP